MKNIAVILFLLVPSICFGQSKFKKGIQLTDSGYVITNPANILYDFIIAPSGASLVNYDFLCDGTEDNEEIQIAIDSLEILGGGNVILLPGNFTIGNMQDDRILKKKRVNIFGYGAIINIPDNCGDSIPTAIECDSGDHYYTGIFGIEINGNNSNNSISSSPYPAGGHGILTARWDYSAFRWGNADALIGTANNIIIRDIYIHNTERSNIVTGGIGHIVESSKFRDTDNDHIIYISGGQKIIYRNIQIEQPNNSPIAIYKAASYHSDLEVEDILIDGLFTTVDFTVNGSTPFIGLVGASDQSSIRNVVINNVFFDGDDGNEESNRLRIIDAKYTKNLTAKIFYRGDMVNGTENLFKFENCQGIKTQLFLESDTSEINSNIFWIKDCEDMDFSGSYVNLKDNQGNSFLKITGSIDNVDLSRISYYNSIGTLVTEDSGQFTDDDPGPGYRTNIKLNNVNFSGDTISDCDSTSFIVNSFPIQTADHIGKTNYLLLNEDISFSPWELDSLIWWIDPNIGVTLTDNNISAISDRKVNYNATQTDDADRPSLSYSSGGKLIQFDSTNTEFLDLPSPLQTKFNSSARWSLCGIFNCIHGPIQILFSSATSSSDRISFTINGQSLRATVYDGSAYSKSSNNLNSGQYYTFVSTYDGAGTLNLYINGIEQTGSNVATTAAADDIKFGCLNNESYYFDGNVGIMLLTESVITETERENIEKYLRMKYQHY